jgi:hypothetical protein
MLCACFAALRELGGFFVLQCLEQRLFALQLVVKITERL